MSGSIKAAYGTAPRCQLTCTNNDTDAAFDPDSVTYVVRKPNGVTTSYVYLTDAEVAKTATGIYTLFPVLDQWGDWYVRATFVEGDITGSDEWRLCVAKPHAVQRTGIYLKQVPAARTIVVYSPQSDDDATVSKSIRMRKSQTLVWLVDYSKTQLDYQDVVDGASAPTVGGAQSANCTISATEGTGWGVDPDGGGVLIRVVTGSSAATTDTIYVEMSVELEDNDAHTVRIPVEIIE